MLRSLVGSEMCIRDSPATISASNLSIRMCPSYMDDMLCRPVGEPVCIYGVVSSDVSWCTNTITRYTASNGTVTSSATPTLSSNGTTQTQSPTFGNTTQSSSHTSSYFPPPCPVAPQPCPYACLLYTSDAADEEDSVDLGGRRIIKKKKKKKKAERAENLKKQTHTEK
eukprot:TRINITY_DN48478_c0_g1_i1.p1 TRINITY_DN48478_c0_g1~~TRINITY_DN48478_c0_g1_i1.p1  ORF type:complete len:168 (-),score=37.62 TRINITY_DN48478_c0_g1_i1:69-572(-)